MRSGCVLCVMGLGCVAISGCNRGPRGRGDGPPAPAGARHGARHGIGMGAHPAVDEFFVI